MRCFIQLKACERCGGDLSLESDRYGAYRECIQCGATLSEPDLISPVTRLTGKRPAVKPARPVLAGHSR